MATDTLFEQSEKVRQHLQPWLQSAQVASNLFKAVEVEQVGERDFRAPFLTQHGMRYGTFDLDGGARGRGTSMKGDKQISTYFSTRGNFEITDLKAAVTAKKEVAIKSAFADALENGMDEYSIQEDYSFHGDGTAVAATATAQATVSGVTVYTLEANMGIQRLRRGAFPVIYDSAFVGVKTNQLYVAAIDYPNKKAIMSGLVPGAAATDVLCYDGVSGTGAAPAWKKGLYYSHQSATSGTVYQVNLATEPEARTNFVNVNGPLNHLFGNLLLDNMDQRRPGSSANVVGLSSWSQRAQIMNNEIQVSRWDRGANDKMLDLLPVRLPSFEFCGVKVMIDPIQDRTRIDFVNPKKWGKAQLKPLDWYTNRAGQRFFTLFAGDGSPAATTWFGLELHEDFVNFDPGSEGMLYGCTAPTGY